MLSEIEIHGYRGIREGRVAGLATVNLFVGANGSGKSTLLEAIFLGAYRAPAYTYQGRPLLAARHNEAAFPSRDCLYAKRDVAAHIEYRFSEGPPMKLRITGLSGGGSIHPDRECPGDETARGYFERMKLLDVRLLLDRDLERQAWDSLLDVRADRTLVKALRDVYRLEVESLSYSAASLALKVLFSDRDHALNLDDLGAGMRIAFRMWCMVLLSPRSAVLAEEIDGFQHVESQRRLARTLFDLAEQHEVQLFLTSHRQETIRTFVEVSLERREPCVKVFQTMLSPDGQFESAGLAADEAESLIEGGVDLRRTVDAH